MIRLSLFPLTVNHIAVAQHIFRDFINFVQSFFVTISLNLIFPDFNCPTEQPVSSAHHHHPKAPPDTLTHSHSTQINEPKWSQTAVEQKHHLIFSPRPHETKLNMKKSQLKPTAPFHRSKTAPDTSTAVSQLEFSRKMSSPNDGWFLARVHISFLPLLSTTALSPSASYKLIQNIPKHPFPSSPASQLAMKLKSKNLNQHTVKQLRLKSRNIQQNILQL